jgi:hypothetical protein
MKRSGFVRKPGKTYATLARSTSIARGTSKLKSARRKPTVAEGSKFIDACRSEECYLRVPGVCCSIGWASPCVVDCHSNQLRHGKGKGIKADNIYTVPGCGPCHAWIDQNTVGTPKQVKFDVWDRAYEAWKPVRAAKMGLRMLEAA